MDVSSEAFDAATKHGQRLSEQYGATDARYDYESGMVKVTLRSKQQLWFRPAAVRGLKKANREQLTWVEVGPGGVTLYFPDLDVDVSIPGLIHAVDGKGIFIS